MIDPIRFQEAQEATAASGTITLGKLGLLIVAKLGPEDELLMLSEFRRQCLPLLKSPLQQIAEDVLGLPAELARVAVRVAVELQAGHTGKGEPSDEMIYSRLNTPEGCAFRVWLHVRGAHPDLSLDQIRAEIREENVIEVLANLWRAFNPAPPANDEQKKTGDGSVTSSASGTPPGPDFTGS